MMGVFYVIGGIGLLVLVVWLLTGTRQIYRCQRCGFETYSELEAAGHEKMENAHRVVKE